MSNNFNITDLIRKNVATLKPYSSARDEFTNVDREMIFLDANENPFETMVNRYPDPQQQDLKSILGAQKGLPIENILLGNGSDEVLDLLFRAFCEPSIDNVITLPPTYGMYKVLADINAIENREVLLTASFEPNVSEILQTQNEMTKLTFLCSPNNPTGNSFSTEEIEQLLTEGKGLIVIDEAYIDFSAKDSWLQRLQEFPNLIITQTLSKAYGMAGIRLGICYAAAEIVSVLQKIKPPYNVNELTQQSAINRLLNIDLVEGELMQILAEKKRLVEGLKTIDFIETVFDSDTNFVLVRVDNANERYEQLLANGIVVRNRSKQPLCANALRITVGTSEENIQLIKTLKQLES